MQYLLIIILIYSYEKYEYYPLLYYFFFLFNTIWCAIRNLPGHCVSIMGTRLDIHAKNCVRINAHLASEIVDLKNGQLLYIPNFNGT